LTEVFRQAAESRIIVNAHRINQGLMPDLAPVESGDFHFVDAADPEEGVRKMLAIVRERIPKRFGFDPIRLRRTSASSDARSIIQRLTLHWSLQTYAASVRATVRFWLRRLATRNPVDRRG